MYVVAQHRISDPQKFFEEAQVAAENAPPGIFGRQFCPSHDRTEAVCLWEAESVDSVRDYIDAIVGDISENAYFAVDAETAIGLPEAIGAGAER